MPIYHIDLSGALQGPIELPPVPGAGLLLPAGFVQLADVLEVPTLGMAWTMLDDQPTQVEDHRGQVYDTRNGEAIEWSQLGKLPELYTPHARPGAHYAWHDAEWVKDEAAALADYVDTATRERDRLQEQASARIAPLQDADELQEATESEKAQLLAWKRYRIALNRLDLEGAYPKPMVWPVSPDAAQ